MNLGTILTLLRMPHLAAQMRLARYFQSSLRLNFLYAATESGLLKVLSAPTSKKGLIEKLGVQRPELLEGLLELGILLRELSCKNDIYEISGRCSHVLSAADGDPVAALIQEYVTYHCSVYRHLAERLHRAPLGNYLEETADVVARSSRTLEPLVGNYVTRVVRMIRPKRMLEIGCGSGVYLRYATEAHAAVTGVAIDMQEAVVKQALANLSEWGMAERFKVIAADVRSSHPDLAGPFDLATLYNNIYYFSVDERPKLFRELHSRLTDKGGLVIVSMMKGDSVMSVNFDLVLRSTIGCAPLPDVEELIEQLKESGFSQVEKTKLVLGEPFYGILAR